MEIFFVDMTFLFFASLFFLLAFALCIHFDVLGIKTRVANGFLSIFNVVLPGSDKDEFKELKIKIAKAATFIFYSVFFVFLISILLSFALPFWLSAEENKYTGPLGDLFNGLLTPILTFLTFCALLITIMIQNMQMKATLQELELTRREMADSTTALEAQVKNSTAQKFDSNFYSLLDYHNKVIEDIVSKNKGLIFDYFGTQTNSIDDFFVGKVLNNKNDYRIYDDAVGIDEILRKWFAYKDIFLTFFLVNFQLLSYIDDANGTILDEDEAKRYSNVLRSLVPNSFLCLLFLNVTAERFGEYKNLVEKYEFLEHMNIDCINLKMFFYLVKKIDIDAFGDGRRFKSYLESKIKNHDLSFFIVNGLYVEIFGVAHDEMPEAHRNDAQEIFEKYKKFVFGLNVFHIVKNKESFGKFIRREFSYFLEEENVLCKELEVFKKKIAKNSSI